MKQLKRLSRTELLELLLEQTQRVETLELELEEARQQLQDRTLKMEKAGDLAQAALAINGVMEAAQQAAQQYLDSIAAMQSRTQLQCEELLQQAQEEAKMIRDHAENKE